MYDNIKGQAPSAIRVNLLLKDAVEINATDLQAEWVVMVQKELCAVACMKQTFIVERLPKPRTGKTLRQLLCQIANNQEFATASTIDDPASINKINIFMPNNGGNQSHKYEVSTSSFIE